METGARAATTTTTFFCLYFFGKATVVHRIGGQVYTGRHRIPQETSEGNFSVRAGNNGVVFLFCSVLEMTSSDRTCPSARVGLEHSITRHTRQGCFEVDIGTTANNKRACIDASKINLMRRENTQTYMPRLVGQLTILAKSLRRVLTDGNLSPLCHFTGRRSERCILIGVRPPPRKRLMGNLRPNVLELCLDLVGMMQAARFLPHGSSIGWLQPLRLGLHFPRVQGH